MIHSLQAATAGVVLGDAAALALQAAVRPPGGSGGRRGMPSPGRQLIQSSEHARTLKKLGLEPDILFSAEPDTSSAVPRVVACGEGWALLRNQP
jgi:hypothetical protein